MKKIILIIIIFFHTSYFILHTSFSSAAEKESLTKEQVHTIDSLKKILKTTDNKGKAKAYNELAEKYTDISSKTALRYANEALKISKQTNNLSEKANALGVLGRINFNKGNNKLAYDYSQQSLTIYTQLSDKKGIAIINNNLGNVYFTWNNYEEALKRYKKSLQLFEEIKDKNRASKILNNIGNIYNATNQYKEAEYYFQKALKIFYELKLDNDASLVLNNIGIIYNKWAKYEIALKYLQQSLKISGKTKCRENISIALTNIGLAYSNMGKYDDALINYNKALDIQNELRSVALISTIYINIAYTYEKKGDFQKALLYYIKSYNSCDKKSAESIAISLNGIGIIYKKLGNYNNALKYLKKSISISDSINRLSDINIENHKDIADLYIKMKDFKNAYANYSLYTVLKDSVYNKESHRQIMEINTKYETEKKDKELILKNKKIEIMNRDKRIAQMQRIALSAGLFLLMVIGFFVYTNMRNKVRKDKEIMEKNRQLFESKNALIQAELEYKNKHVVDMGIQIVNKNNMLQEITENITEIKSALQKEEKENAINKLENLSKIMGINLKIDVDHEEFNKHLELVNEGFYFKLNQRFPDLTDYEKRLASLLKMNLSSNEISVLLNISPSSVNISRYRLRKKLNLEEKENINDFLNKI